jgi:hypothetical protein
MAERKHEWAGKLRGVADQLAELAAAAQGQLDAPEGSGMKALNAQFAARARLVRALLPFTTPES